MKFRLRALLCCASLLALCGCDSLAPDIFDPKSHDVIDRTHGLSRNDYRNMLKPDAPLSPTAQAEKGFDGYQTVVSAKTGEPPIPELSPILAAPQPPKLGNTKLVSLAVTDDVPLKDVLLELSRLADVDIEIDAGISGGIAFRASQRPFNEVIERIADLAGLRYTMKNNVLRVERDSPYVEVYTIDFLNMDRSNESTVNISTNVLSSSGGYSSSGGGSSSSSGGASGGGGSSSGGLNTGSTSTITAKTESDFWKQFEESVKQILAFTPVSHVGQANIPTQPAPAASAPAADSGTPQAAPASPIGAAAALSAATTSAITAATATPAQPAAASSNASSSGGAVNASEKPFFILNRQASTLTVSATERQHRLLKEFLRKVQSSASAQVLIEAKIVEVSLDQEFASGIDWSTLGGSKVSFANQFAGPTDNTNVATLTFRANDLTGLNIDLNGAVRLAENFGTTRTLSSPRLHAINNQPAVLTFAENRVYFQLTIEQSTTTSVGNTTNTSPITVNSEIKTVPIGIILTMMPSINLESNEVTLSVRPTLSRITSFVNDPAVAYLAAQQVGAASAITSQIPVVEVRELDSILKLQSGQVMVIGGLMEDKSTNEDNGIPGINQVPVVGNLFKGISRDNSTKELVIFIRATILDSRGNVPQADKALYQKYITDPRPIAF